VSHICIDFDYPIDVIPKYCTHLKFRKNYSHLLFPNVIPITVQSICFV
jgi:hypothetical protein